MRDLAQELYFLPPALERLEELAILRLRRDLDFGHDPERLRAQIREGIKVALDLDTERTRRIARDLLTLLDTTSPEFLTALEGASFSPAKPSGGSLPAQKPRTREAKSWKLPEARGTADAALPKEELLKTEYLGDFLRLLRGEQSQTWVAELLGGFLGAEVSQVALSRWEREKTLLSSAAQLAYVRAFALDADLALHLQRLAGEVPLSASPPSSEPAT